MRRERRGKPGKKTGKKINQRQRERLYLGWKLVSQELLALLGESLGHLLR
jgi:hypothetical protein